jgi:hypothetical protein
MDITTFEELKRRAIQCVSVEVIKCDYIDPSYKLILNKGEEIRKTTGHLIVVKIVPKVSPDDFNFTMRWDEKKQAVDVDLENIAKRDWPEYGFSRESHHTQKLLPDLKFQADIRLAERKIFQGIIEVVIKTENTITHSIDTFLRK